jgi:hypothetical protein
MPISQNRLNAMVQLARRLYTLRMAEWHKIQALNQDLAMKLIPAEEYILRLKEMAADPFYLVAADLARIEKEELIYDMTHKRNEYEARRKSAQRWAIGLEPKKRNYIDDHCDPATKQMIENGKKMTKDLALGIAQAEDPSVLEALDKAGVNFIDEAELPPPEPTPTIDPNEWAKKHEQLDKPATPYDKRGLV